MEYNEIWFSPLKNQDKTRYWFIQGFQLSIRSQTKIFLKFTFYNISTTVIWISRPVPKVTFERFSLSPQARPLGQAESWYWCVCLSVCLFVCVCVFVGHPTHNSYSPIFNTLNYGLTFELWVNSWITGEHWIKGDFLIMGQLLIYGSTFKLWVNFKIMGKLLNYGSTFELWVNFWIMGQL